MQINAKPSNAKQRIRINAKQCEPKQINATQRNAEQLSTK
jgi:hypothetical protein